MVRLLSISKKGCCIIHSGKPIDMGFDTIQNWSLGNYLLKTYARFWHNVFFYHRTTVRGKHYIPKDGHLIFTANHQNALMDAMALVVNSKTQPIFLARSDIFGKPLMASFLYFLKILPVYRIRDGFNTLKKNDAIFEKTIEVINKKRGLGMLPEGNYSGIHRLRILKKGFARIAFQTEEASGFTLNIKIIPVGLDYTDSVSYRSSLLVNYGPPLSVSDYYDRYKKEPVKAINQIRDDLGACMKSLIVHIESEEFYTLYDELREIFKRQMAKILSLKNCRQPLKLKADQELIRRLASREATNKEGFTKLQNRIGALKAYIEKHHFSYDLFYKGNVSPVWLISGSLFVLLTFPVFLYGYLTNILPYWFPIKVSRKFKDPQFHSSIKFAVSMVGFPVYYLIIALLSKIFLPWMWVGLFFISLLCTGAFAYAWVQLVKKLSAQWRFLLLKLRKNREFMQMLEHYQYIVTTTRKFVSEE